MRIVKKDVVVTALRLLNQVGIEGLTMRKLADELHIQAPSLYWHFASKEALLASMADAMIEPVARYNVVKEDWESGLFHIVHDLRRAFLSFRDGARVFAGTYSLSENILRVGSLLIECLKMAGMDDRTAIWGVFSILYFIIGFCIEEQALTEKTAAFEKESNIQALLGKYPLADMAVREITESTADERFQFGIQLQIESLRNRVTS